MGEHLPDVYFQTAFELGNRNLFERASVYFERVYKEYPDSPPADASRFYSGISYFILQKYDQALPLLNDYAMHGKDPQLRQQAQDLLKQIQDRVK
jgi:hypothetical protein